MGVREVSAGVLVAVAAVALVTLVPVGVGAGQSLTDVAMGDSYAADPRVV